jgi:hypothetical protein
MVPDKINHVDPAGKPTPPDRRAEKASSDPAFRRMLERLEDLVKQGGTDAVKPGAPKLDPSKVNAEKPDASKSDTTEIDDSEKFMDAMRKADDNFVTAMDLRRKLEEAYRRSQP